MACSSRCFRLMVIFVILFQEQFQICYVLTTSELLKPSQLPYDITEGSHSRGRSHGTSTSYMESKSKEQEILEINGLQSTLQNSQTISLKLTSHIFDDIVASQDVTMDPPSLEHLQTSVLHTLPTFTEYLTSTKQKPVIIISSSPQFGLYTHSNTRAPSSIQSEARYTSIYSSEDLKSTTKINDIDSIQSSFKHSVSIVTLSIPNPRLDISSSGSKTKVNSPATVDFRSKFLYNIGDNSKRSDLPTHRSSAMTLSSVLLEHSNSILENLRTHLTTYISSAIPTSVIKMNRSITLTSKYNLNMRETIASSIATTKTLSINLQQSTNAVLTASTLGKVLKDSNSTSLTKKSYFDTNLSTYPGGLLKPVIPTMHSTLQYSSPKFMLSSNCFTELKQSTATKYRRDTSFRPIVGTPSPLLSMGTNKLSSLFVSSDNQYKSQLTIVSASKQSSNQVSHAKTISYSVPKVYPSLYPNHFSVNTNSLLSSSNIQNTYLSSLSTIHTLITDTITKSPQRPSTEYPNSTTLAVRQYSAIPATPLLVTLYGMMTDEIYDKSYAFTTTISIPNGSSDVETLRLSSTIAVDALSSKYSPFDGTTSKYAIITSDDAGGTKIDQQMLSTLQYHSNITPIPLFSSNVSINGKSLLLSSSNSSILYTSNIHAKQDSSSNSQRTMIKIIQSNFNILPSTFVSAGLEGTTLPLSIPSIANSQSKQIDSSSVIKPPRGIALTTTLIYNQMSSSPQIPLPTIETSSLHVTSPISEPRSLFESGSRDTVISTLYVTVTKTISVSQSTCILLASVGVKNQQADSTGSNESNQITIIIIIIISLIALMLLVIICMLFMRFKRARTGEFDPLKAKTKLWSDEDWILRHIDSLPSITDVSPPPKKPTGNQQRQKR